MTRLALLRIASLPYDALSALAAPTAARAAEHLVAWDDTLDREGRALAAQLHAHIGPPAPGSDDGRRFALLHVRRALHNGRAPRDEPLARACEALDSATAARLCAWCASLCARTRAREVYEAVVAAAMLKGQQALLERGADALVEHALFLASPTLLPKVQALRRRGAGGWSHGERHTAAKLTAYLTRCATKTSPNGLFCAVALADVGAPHVALDGTLTLAATELLLNVAEARKIAACLAIDPVLAGVIVPRPNPTLRATESGWTYWRPVTSRAPTNVETFTRLKPQPMVALFLEEAARGNRTGAALVAAVAARSGHDEPALRTFFDALVERGVLIAEIELPYNCRRPLRHLARVARASGATPEWLPALEQAEAQLDAAGCQPLDERTGVLRAVTTSLDALPHVRPLQADELFRVDAVSACQVRLPARVADDVHAAVAAVARLLATIYPEELHAAELHARFLAAHPADTEVELLDLYRGAEGREQGPRPLEFAAGGPPAPPGTRLAHAQAALARLRDALAQRARDTPSGDTLALDEDFLRVCLDAWPSPRWSCGALFQVAARCADALEAGDYQIVLSALFNGPGLALARFAHLLGARAPGGENPVVAELRRAWSALARPGAVLAELTYNHDGRTANAGLRPALWAHEIELPGEACSPGVTRLPLADLRLRYDSAAHRLVLTSRALGCEVVPVLSSGVNPVGLISDLVQIGRQGWQAMGWLPGFEHPDVMRWPRIALGRVVLWRARWVLRGVDWPAWPQAGGAAAQFLACARWRARLGLPRRVFVHTSAEPKPFHVDFEAPLLVDLLQRALARALGQAAPVLYVTEMLPGPEDLWIQDQAGRGHATEFLLQLQTPD